MKTLSSASPDTDTIRIGVRALAEYVHRTGGLSPVVFSDLTAVEGTRAHQRFFKAYAAGPDKPDIETEVPLEGVHTASGLTLRISGRADAVIRQHPSQGTAMRVVEAKTVSGNLDDISPGGDTVHWAQAMLYACLYESMHPEELVDSVSLFYLSVETVDALEFDRTVTTEELQMFFQRTCQSYLRWAADVLHYRKARDSTAMSIKFPYPNIRAGQKPFMRQVLAAIQQRSAMLIQAPTGIGKTMSALFPAVKALSRHMTDNVFYLTAKASTRAAAENAMEDLRHAGLVMKSITLYAKESLCPVPELYCDGRQCPYALGYYEKIHLALDHLMALPAVTRESLLACAKKHEVCPFELSLDFSLYCDLIICDYNYVFDPRVRLMRYFDEPSDARRLLLVDEAHNLPDRAREMYSADLSDQSLRDAAGVLEGVDPGLDRSLAALSTHFGAITTGLAADSTLIDQLEEGLSPADVLVAQSFRATRVTPAKLMVKLWRFVHQCRDLLDELPSGAVKRKVLDFFFSAVFFLKIAEEYFDSAYVTTYSLNGKATVIRLMCLDASARIASFYRNRYPIVFFSATLSPVRYFERLLAGRNAAGALDIHVLPSPFPPENLLVCVAGTISTRYRQRSETVFQVASTIDAAISVKTGNYLVFLSSFEYLRQVHAAFMEIRRKKRDQEILVQTQSGNMSEMSRKKYLDMFSRYGKQTLVSFAVLGGVFGEGIDLAGDRLSGVVIVGTGLPMFCPEREIMKEYYQNSMDGGFEYAYMYPGFNKVQQAAGRVIRSEEDRGFVILVDDRYLRPEYLELLPEEWNALFVNTTEELADHIRWFG